MLREWPALRRLSQRRRFAGFAMAEKKAPHSTLERKIRLVFGLMILLIVVASFFFPWYQMESLVSDQDVVSAREMARSAWLALHTRALSPKVADDLKKLEQLGPPPSKEKAQQPRIVLPDAPAARPDAQPRDELESKWLQRFGAHADKPEDYDWEQMEDGYFFRYAYPLRAREACVECHRVTNPDIKSGDLMGAIVVTFPTEETRTKLTVNRGILIAAAFATAILSTLFLYAVVRLIIVRPVRHLKQTADRISEGDFNVRSDIRTGDEFEALSRSFNRMLQRLDAAREELRRTNISLDHKLEELARANVALFEMNQMKSKFLTTMSHELRTPLNAILGFADILENNEAIQANTKLARYVENIRDSGQLLLDIINDLLDLAKIEAGRMEPKVSQVSPLDLAETAMNMVRPMVAGKDLRLEMEVAPECPIMATDANKVQQILYNLLSNAVKFTPAGSVRLAVRPIDPRTLLFQVVDTGPGLSKDQQKLIFDRFTQIDSGHTRQYGGTGLGLSIVHELVTILGGEVAVQSDLGQGATFNVTLPVTYEAPQEETEEVEVTKVEPSPQPPKPPSEEKAPEPVTAEDTVVAAEADVEADALKPDETASQSDAADR